MADDYHSNYARVSKTMLNHFAKSTQDFHDYYVKRTRNPPPPKRVMVIGSAVHEVLLEGKDIQDCCITYPPECFKTNGAINPKPAREFEAEHADKYTVKANDLSVIASTIEAVRSHELGRLLELPGVKFEQPVYWTCPETGLLCRCKPDFYCEHEGRILAYDLKTTEQIYPGEFERTAKRFRYWLQDAHYSAGLTAETGLSVDFRFWCVETLDPHRIAPREYDPRSREIAEGAYRNLMGQLAECKATGRWADEWTQKVTQMTLGPWDVGHAAEAELTGFDDE